MEPRNEALEQYLDVAGAAVRHYARFSGLDYNDAEDCVADFQRRRLCCGQSGDLSAATAEERRQVWREAQWFVKRWIHESTKRKQAAPTQSLDQMRSDSDDGIIPEPASHDPGPERAALNKIEMDTVVIIVRAFTPRQQWLWRRACVGGDPIVELASAAGTTPNALYIELGTIRARIRRILNR